MKALITPREDQVWSMAVQGLTKKEIAVHLQRSYHTVNQMYRNLYSKLNIRKETDLVREWFVYHSFCTAQELKEFLKHHAAPAVIAFLLITAAQIFLDTPAVRGARRTNSGATRTARAGRGREGREGRKEGRSEYYL
jgi:DNA-binding CsgD family transcriptional regulator